MCNRNYVGQTSSPMNIRFNNYKTDIRKLKVNRQKQEIEIRHFAKHGIDNIGISIFDVIPIEIERKLCENNMMKKYRTI